MGRGFGWLKKTNPKAYKAFHKVNAKTHESSSQVHAAMSRVLGYTGEEAEMLTEAAKDYLAAGDIRKAIKSYESASKIYDKTSKIYRDSEEGSEINQTYQRYHKKSLDCKRQIDRLKRFHKGRWHGLEGKATTIISIGEITLGLLFLSPNITGNAILGLQVKSTSFIGAILFIIGLIAGFFGTKNL